MTHARRVCTALLVGAALALPATSRPAPSADAAFARLASRYFAQKMELDPLTASATLALPRYEGRLEITIAPEHIAKARALNEQTLRALQVLPRHRLGARGRLSHELLQWELQLALDGDEFPGHLMPIDQFGGLPLALATLASGDQAQALKTPRDYDNYLLRLGRLPAYTAQAIANMRQGMAQGFTVPRALIETALPTFERLAEADFERSAFGVALQVMPHGFGTAERERIGQAYRRAHRELLQPTLQALLEFLRGPYLEACRTSAGMAALPNGAAFYAYLVRLHTTTTRSPEEIHALGLAEVARIRGEMAAVQALYGFEGSVTEFLKWHAKEPRFRPYQNWAQLLAAYTELNQRVVPQLGRLFGRLPRQALQLRVMPELQRATQDPYYNPPSPDGKRPGIFFIGAPVEPAQLNNAIMTSLLLHEGQPGHHFQLSLQYEQPLPAFRRYGWSTAFGEGWALYAESLGRDLGLYADPNQYLGFLKLELLRAVRLVADTGLHARGWTRDETMRYMMDTEGASEVEARVATERYMAVPGQALAYKIGALEIQALRASARSRLGPRFSIRAFHDLVLAQGTVPLPVLGRVVDDWIGRQLAVPGRSRRIAR